MVLCVVFVVIYLIVEGFNLCCFLLDSFCRILCWLFLVGGFVGFCFLVVVELIVEVDASFVCFNLFSFVFYLQVVGAVVFVGLLFSCCCW